jgi:chaperonin GroES
MATQIGELNPTADRVLLRRLSTETELTAGGIIIPDNAQETGDAAEVVAVGPGAQTEGKPGQHDPMDVSVGDTVLINKYAGTEVESGGSTYLVVREKDILARVE